jgi:hypothetical protein
MLRITSEGSDVESRRARLPEVAAGACRPMKRQTPRRLPRLRTTERDRLAAKRSLAGCCVAKIDRPRQPADALQWPAALRIGNTRLPENYARRNTTRAIGQAIGQWMRAGL